LLVACLATPVLAMPAGAHDGPHGGPAVDGGGASGDGAGLAGLAGAQEALLNAYRCMFAVDVQVVPGGCVDGTPAAIGPLGPGANEAVDAAALSELVIAQEALLNAYRCMFAVDVQVVPGGCVDGTPAAGPAAVNEAEDDRGNLREPVDCSGLQHCLISFSGRGSERWCGLRADQTVICTDSRGDAPLSRGSHGPFEGQLQSVSAGRNYACGVGVDQAVRCWSYNWQLEPAMSPEGRFLSVSAGIGFTEFACGIKDDHTAVCWGDDALGTESERIAAPDGRFLSVSAGWQHACGIKENQTVVCWGDNTHGRLEAPAGRFLSVSAGFWFSCGIRENRTATCWGNNLRRGYNAPIGRFLEVSAGQGFACGLHEDQTVVCWGPPGAGTFGELDPPEGQFLSISAGRVSGCALRAYGTLECWGAVAATAWPTSGFSFFECSWCRDPTKKSGEFDVHVFYCARAGKFTQADLEHETDRMNDIASAFWTRESSGLAQVRFVPAGLATHDLDWDNATINSLFEELEDPQKAGPCEQSAGAYSPHRHYQHILLLADVSPGERSNVPCPGACAGYPVLMPTVEALYASEFICPTNSPPRLVRQLPGARTASPGKDTAFGNIRAGHNTNCRDLAYWVYDYLVAHELGHALFGFGHPPDCSIMSGNPWACPPTRAHNMDDTLRNPNLLQTSFIGCADRQQAGWPQDPERCPQDP